MADRIGPAFRGELAAVGLGDGIGSAADGTLYFAASVSESDKAKAEAVLAAHDPTTPAPSVPPAPYVLFKTDVVTRMTDRRTRPVRRRPDGRHHAPAAHVDGLHAHRERRRLLRGAPGAVHGSLRRRPRGCPPGREVMIER